jgi:GH43 family beta-xylosidase
LREQNRVLDQKVTDYYNTIASKEFENIELREKIEGLKKEEPIVLARGIIYLFSYFACE